MSVKPKLTTADELFEMGSDARAELVCGELREMTPSGFEHARIAGKLAGVLSGHVTQHDLGVVLVAEPGFVLSEDPDTVRAPDVSFVSKANIPDDEELTGFARFAPDLVVEVISPSERAADVNEKIHDYLRAGVKLIWIVHPKTKTVTEYRSRDRIRTLAEADALDGHDVVPGFSAPIEKLFS